MSAVVSTARAWLRPMQEVDLPAVLKVEEAAYEFPWTLGIFRDCLKVGYVCKLLETAEGIIGHGVMSLAAGECHLLNICVQPRNQSQGYGRQIVIHLLDLARERGARMAFLEVRVSNRAAHHLYTDLGFNEIGVRKGYYPAAHNSREDAIILARDLI